MLTDLRMPFSGDEGASWNCDGVVGLVWRAGRLGLEAAWLEAKEALGLMILDGVRRPVVGIDEAPGEARGVEETVLDGALILETGN